MLIWINYLKTWAQQMAVLDKKGTNAGTIIFRIILWKFWNFFLFVLFPSPLLLLLFVLFKNK